VRYKVYIWGFSCLKFFFDVLISWIGNLSLYNWFCHIYFTYYLISCSCVSVLTTLFFNACLYFEFIDTRVFIPARHLLFITPLVGQFLLPWIYMSRSWGLELVDSPGCWSEMCSGSVDHRQTIQNLFLPTPCSSLEFSFCNSWALFILFIILYLYSRIYVYRWCNILIKLCHILW